MDNTIISVLRRSHLSLLLDSYLCALLSPVCHGSIWSILLAEHSLGVASKPMIAHSFGAGPAYSWGKDPPGPKGGVGDIYIFRRNQVRIRLR